MTEGIVKRLLVLAFLFVGACSDSTSPPRSVTGSWSGSVPRQTGGNAVFTATLMQNGTTVTGTGSIGGPELFPITGTASQAGHVTFTYDLSAQEDPPTSIRFEGDLVTTVHIAGVLTGWANGPVSITFRRTP
jgi:hypothetical protein